MANVILGSYMVRYPLGGMLSWALQYLVGFRQLGHKVFFVEKSGYPNSCFDPVRGVMSDDCTTGTRLLHVLFERFGLEYSWCFVDAAGVYHGMSRRKIEEEFRSADVFVDMGTHGTWLEEGQECRLRVLIDGEPGFTQMKMEKKRAAGEALPEYDFYFTTGQNIGTAGSPSPSAGKSWHHIFHPVVVNMFPRVAASGDGCFTTVMNWQSYNPVEFRGRTYGHKDIEFQKFIDLPGRTSIPLELAVSGGALASRRLSEAGWRLRNAQQVTKTFDTFIDYIQSSRGEFSVCKNGFVATHSGWFSDRSAVYLASSRPVVMQETGFSEHLPCGRGLFAVNNVDEAAAALEQIASDYEGHQKAAEEISHEYLDARKVLQQFLNTLGL